MSDREVLALIRKAIDDVAPERAAQLGRLTLENKIEDLKLDSVSMIEMIAFLEEKLCKTFRDEDLAEVSSLGDLATLMRKNGTG